MSDHLPPELEALIVDALSGALDEGGRARLEAAIENDPSLGDRLEEQAEVVASLSPEPAALGELEAARLRREVLDAVAPAEVPAAPVPTVRPWVRWAFSAAAVLVLVVGAVGFLSQGGDDAVEFAETAAVTEAAEAPADEARDGGADDAAEGVEESVAAQSDLADDAASADAAAGALAPVGEADLACAGTTIQLEEPLTFPSVDEAVRALSSEPRGAFDPRGLEHSSSPGGDLLPIRVTWFDGDLWAYQVLVEPTGDGWEVRSLLVCDG